MYAGDQDRLFRYGSRKEGAADKVSHTDSQQHNGHPEAAYVVLINEMCKDNIGVGERCCQRNSTEERLLSIYVNHGHPENSGCPFLSFQTLDR